MCKGPVAGGSLVCSRNCEKGHRWERQGKEGSKTRSSHGFFGEWMEVTVSEDLNIPLAAKRGNRDSLPYNKAGRRQEWSGIWWRLR